jgi:hypothetical protein
MANLQPGQSARILRCRRTLPRQQPRPEVFRDRGGIDNRQPTTPNPQQITNNQQPPTSTRPKCFLAKVWNLLPQMFANS